MTLFNSSKLRLFVILTSILAIIGAGFWFTTPLNVDAFETQTIPGKPEPIKQNTPRPNPQIRPQTVTIINPGNIGSPSVWMDGASYNQGSGLWNNNITSSIVGNVSQSNPTFRPVASFPSPQFSAISENRSGGMNFQNTLAFTDGNKSMRSAVINSSSLIGNDFTMFVVARPNTDFQGTLLNFGDNSECGNLNLSLDTFGFEIGIHCNQQDRLNFDDRGLSPTQNRPQVYAINSESANVSAFLNGKQNGSKTMGAGFNLTSTLQFGSGNSAGFLNFDGDMSEVLVYPFSLDETYMNQITSYLGVKYGITLASDYHKTTTPFVPYLQADHSGENQTIYAAIRDDGFSLNSDYASSSQQNNDRMVLDIGYRGGLEPNGYQFASQLDGGDWSETTNDVPAGVSKRINQIWHFEGSQSTRIMDLWIDITGYNGGFQDFRIIESDTPNMNQGNAILTSSSFLGNQFVPVHTFKNGKYYSLATGIAGGITIDPLRTSDNTPSLTGTTSKCCFPIQIQVNGQTYQVNNGGSWWQLDDNIIDALPDGVYDVIATYDDGAGDMFSDTTTNELTIDTTPPISSFLQQPDLYQDIGSDFVLVEAFDNIELRSVEFGYTFDNCDNSTQMVASNYFNVNGSNVPHYIVGSDFNGQYVCVKTTDSVGLISYIRSENPIDIKAVVPMEIQFAPDIGPGNLTNYQITGTCEYARGNEISVYINQSINVAINAIKTGINPSTIPGVRQANLVQTGACTPDGRFSLFIDDLSGFPDGPVNILLEQRNTLSGQLMSTAERVVTKNTTTALPDLDGDNDGILTATEQLAPNNGDGNNDGYLDQNQANVASVPYQNSFITVEVSSNNSQEDCYQLSQITAKTPVADMYEKPEIFLDGVVEFRASCSGEMKVKIFWYTDADPGNVKLVKCDPAKSSGLCILEDIKDVVFGNTEIGGKKVITTEYVVVDQGFGDTDPAVGELVDPVGLVIRSLNSSSPTPPGQSTTLTPTFNPRTSLIRTGGK
jgi:hypothetical protein